MTSNASHAAGARSATTTYTVNVALTPDDLTMVRAFTAWAKNHPKRSPKKDEIERGYGDHTFFNLKPRANHAGGYRILKDTTGPNVFKRLVALRVIEHSSNGHCWLTAAGKALAADLETTTTKP